MADPAFDDPIPNLDTLPIPDDPFLSDDLAFSDHYYDDVLNFNLDDLDLDNLLNSINPSSNSIQPDSFHDDANHLDFSSSDVVVDISGGKSSDNSKCLNNPSSENSNSRDFCQEFGNNDFGGSGPVSSQGSDDCVRSFDNSPASGNRVVDHKRKKEEEEGNSVIRTIKSRRSNEVTDRLKSNEGDDEDEKKKARLIRNRESAHLSRQKKKQYIEELEDKVRAMHSTIQDLNARISYFVAENNTLKQQMNCGSIGPQPMGMYPTPAMAPMGFPWAPYPPYYMKPQGSQVPLVPIPRLKPKVQHDKISKNGESKRKEGRSKTKKVASVSFLGFLFFILLFGGLVPMVSVKHGGLTGMWLGRSDYEENRFGQEHHVGKVLVVNGTDHDSGTRFSGKNLDNGNMKNYDSNFDCHRGHFGAARANMKQTSSEDFAPSGNVSDRLVASLYVPRNDKLVKIDGNLIIHSVLASEKAKLSNEDGQTKNGKNSLAVPSSLAPAISYPGGQNIENLPHLYRSTAGHKVLPSGKDDPNSAPRNGELQQWFLEGLGGPVLRSGMCTEVFQFDVSPTPGSITPANSVRNVSVEEKRNSTHLNKGQNRKILRGLPIPLPGSANNISEESGRSNSKKDKSNRNSTYSPMIVSVLVDPREAGDFGADGMLGTKPLSRIFVVVLLDSVKYVTYSCMLPFKGSNMLGTA
ncbi:hypothetical protein DCAR_0625762 [Daucus carota subsp. sativus]|uniref:BZIP domain-containing protein n=1 Tax=Daucus carota subsp. sativus TaxID=79200 RepID=A0A164WNR3_DAUCS|nr:PREDICTED: bZIP transcription factor 17-like [Daucus carota subsp. sativus]WOH06337.1 hypothetical protein DCAR_0625762 [Daucus carota subsp. sativus]